MMNRMVWKPLPALFVLGAIIGSGCVQPPELPANASGNRPPVIASLTADPPEIAVGEGSTIRVQATDPENNPLSYSWRASTGDIIGEGAEVQFTASYCCAGPNFVQVTVRDNAGGETSRLVDVLIYY